MGYSCSQTQGNYLRISIGCEFWMGEFPRCGGWNLVRSGKDSSSNVGTRPKPGLSYCPLPFFKVTCFPGQPSNLWRPLPLSRLWLVSAGPSHGCSKKFTFELHCLFMRMSWLLIRKVPRANPGGTSLHSDSSEVSVPFVQVWGWSGGEMLCFSRTFSISEVPYFPFVLGIQWSVSKSPLGCGYPTGPSKKRVWTPGLCWVMCRLDEVFFFSCWLVISSLSFFPPLKCVDVWGTVIPPISLAFRPCCWCIGDSATPKDTLLYSVPHGW